MPPLIATMMTATPRSGSASTRPMTGTVQATARASGRAPGRGDRSPAAPKTSAIIMIRPILAYSEGSIWNPPGSGIQEWRAVDRGAEGAEHHQQPEEARRVGERRDHPQDPVVDQGHPGHHDQADHHDQQLLLQVGVRVGARLGQAGRGRRPDQQSADQRQREHGENQNPVHVPQHRVPGQGLAPQAGPAQRGHRGLDPAEAEPRSGADRLKPAQAPCGAAAPEAHHGAPW